MDACTRLASYFNGTLYVQVIPIQATKNPLDQFVHVIICNPVWLGGYNCSAITTFTLNYTQNISRCKQHVCPIMSQTHLYNVYNK